MKLLIAQIINFALFYFIFKKFIAKPFSAFFNLEIEKEKEKEKILDKLKKQEEEMIQKEKIARQNLKKEADEVLGNARVEGEQLKKEILQSAKKESDEIVKKSRRQIEEERIQMEADLNKKALQLAMLTVSKGLNQFLTEEMQKAITANILKNFSKN